MLEARESVLMSEGPAAVGIPRPRLPRFPEFPARLGDFSNAP